MARLRSILIGFVGAALVTAPLSLAAQAVAQGKLKPANAKLDEEFTQVTSVRELSDGRVLVTDGRENRVVVADFKTGTVAQIGRNGQGPGEYQVAGILHAIGGDSSLMADGRGGRWHLFDGARLVATLPPDAPIITAMSRSVMDADARGNVFRTIVLPPNLKALSAGTPDSGFVVRGRRSNARIDTIAQVKLAKVQITTTTNAKGEIATMRLLRPPLSVGEEVALYPDGWFAIVRLDPYRVEWISPDGKVTRGSELPWPVVRVDDREKTAYYMARSRDAARTSGGPVPESVRKQVEEASKLFPETYPPIVTDGLIALADGRLLVRHPESVDFPNVRYDLVDRRGKLGGTIALARGESIVAVTQRAAYVVWKDDDDIERLRRHPRPPPVPVKP